MKLLPALATALLLTVSVPQSSIAATVGLGTAGNAANWFITGAGAAAVPSIQTNVNRTGAITLTSNALSSGTFIPGASLAAFNGFWLADRPFTLPSDATDVALSFSALFGNDRVVLQLNGTTIGNGTNSGTNGAGVMSFTSGLADAPFTFTNTTSGTVTSGFVPGLNTLRLIINNTGVASISAPTVTMSGGDGTTAFLNATLTYNVPEPGTALFLITGSMTLLCCRKRQRS